MSRGRRWLVGTLVGVLAVGVTARVAWSRLDDGPYAHTLVRFDDDRGETNRYTNLDDRAAQLSVGSPDGHDLVVQWRDPDGHGWTAPETVWRDEQNLAIENTVRYGAGTVAIVETYTPDTSDDSDIHDVSVAVVCRDLSCDATDAGGIDSEAQVTPDGSLVYVGQTERTVQWWSEDEGFHRTAWSGRPGSDFPRLVVSGPVLAPDGSLRLVSGRFSPGRCTFELLTGPPRSGDLAPVARHTQPLRGDLQSDCQTYVDTFSSDWVAVSSFDHRASDFWFVRAGDSWTTTRDDPSGLETIDVSRTECCDTGVVGFVHWNDVAYGSPDGRRMQVQTHLLGDERWSAPQLLDGAPPGYRCTWLEGYEVGDGFLLLMTCHEAGGPVESPFSGDAYAVAASTDLEQWETAWVADVRKDPEVSHDGLRLGRLTWTADQGFETH
ncbi:MAG TPA: hypothetical protein VGE14_09725 [Marmoricola sp.]